MSPQAEVIPFPPLDPPPAEDDWTVLVDRVREGDDSCISDLYKSFAKAVRYYVCRHLGAQELEDKIHDTFLLVIQAIRRGELRDRDRLMGFARTIVKRQVALHIHRRVHHRQDHLDHDATFKVPDPRGGPEEDILFRQRLQLIRQVLEELGKRDREILTRFYLREQSQAQICEEMALTVTQFRLLKSRAKARFGELGRKKLAQGTYGAIFVRTSASCSH
jgi:RNA polymerase sigma factor (sigma-70 family)